MADNDDSLSVTLPDALRRQFAQVERRLWRVETALALCSVAGGLLLSFLVLFVSDRFWDTPKSARTGCLLCGLAIAVVASLFWARRWIWRRRDLRDLAILVQKKYRRLGDRLLGIVELAGEKRHFANFSPALYHAAIHQVAAEAKSYDFGQSVSAARARKMSFAAAGLAACVLAVFALVPRPGWNALLRWAVPTAGIARYTLVSLEGLPRELIVANGEPFNLDGAVHYRSFWKPGRVSALWPRQPPLQSAVRGGTFHLTVPGQVEEGTLRVRVGDALAEVRVLPAYRPSLQELDADIQLPDYLHYPSQTERLPGGALLAVEGSRIAFHGKTSRPLRAALMQSAGEQPKPLKIDGDTFSSESTQPEGAAEFDFNWRDNLGLSNAVPLRLSVRMEPDAPPAPEIPDLPRETAVLASDVLRIRVRATDDFGVRDYGLMWDLTADSPPTQIEATEIKTQTPSPRIKTTEKVFLWSPAVFRIPADSTVELQAFARDYLPERDRALTGIYRIHVLSAEAHAELVREQLEAVMAQVEEVTRLQEKIVAALAEVKDSQKMPEAQKSTRLGQSKDDQLENASRLDELSRQGERALREGMKNPLLTAETIRQWSQSLQQWRQLSQNKMQDAASAMQSARQNPASQPQQTADALQKAQDVLNELEKMESKANQHMDDLQALTLSQRLRKVGSEEKDISGVLVGAAPDTIGLLPRDLPEKWKLFEYGLTRHQAEAQKETVTLQGEISRFFERTQKTNYGAVSQEMKTTRASDELERLGGLIDNNMSIEASDNLGQWSGRFQKWSDALEPKQESKGSGSGSSGGQKEMDLTQQLIALLRVRENEITLRDQTSVLDQNKAQAPDYKQRAASLSDGQATLSDDLERIRQKTPLSALDTAFSQSSAAMKTVAGLLRQPETGKPADAAEVATIEDLSDLINLINEQAQRPSPQPSQSSGDKSSDEEMQFLLQMMRNSANAKEAAAFRPATGLNRAGGSTGRNAGRLDGDAAGRGPGARQVRQATGVMEDAPAEYRDALENYYHGIEQSQ